LDFIVLFPFIVDHYFVILLLSTIIVYPFCCRSLLGTVGAGAVGAGIVGAGIAVKRFLISLYNKVKSKSVETTAT
jgi:hypothetical protein